jgi:hypothetical protein
MKHIRIFFPAAIFMFSSAANADCVSAQATIDTCWQEANPAMDVKLKEEKTDENVQNLIDLVTGTAGMSGDSATTLTNFLPLLGISGFSEDISGNSDNKKSADDLKLEFNVPFIGSAGDNALKLGASFVRNPEVYESLLETVADSNKEEFKTKTNGNLSIGDDATFSLSYNLTNRMFGRSFAMHREMFNELYDQALAGLSTPAVPLARVIEVQRLVVTRLGEDVNPPGNADTFADWQQAEPAATRAVFDDILALYQEAAKAEAAINDAENRYLRANGILDFYKLVDNQPQLMLNYSTTERNALVGPDEESLSLVFEFPLGANLFSLNRSNGSCKSSWRSDGCLQAYSRYISTLTTGAQNAPRISLKYEYKDIDTYNLTLDGGLGGLNKAGSTSKIVTAGYGVRLDEKNSRLDIAYKDEDVSDDAARNDRKTASITYSFQAGDLTIPISLIYSNKPEYLLQQDLDHNLSATVGIKYEFKKQQ